MNSKYKLIDNVALGQTEILYTHSPKECWSNRNKATLTVGNDAVISFRSFKNIYAGEVVVNLRTNAALCGPFLGSSLATL